jgi:hypothetical protein
LIFWLSLVFDIGIIIYFIKKSFKKLKINNLQIILTGNQKVAGNQPNNWQQLKRTKEGYCIDITDRLNDDVFDLLGRSWVLADELTAELTAEIILHEMLNNEKIKKLLIDDNIDIMKLNNKIDDQIAEQTVEKNKNTYILNNGTKETLVRSYIFSLQNKHILLDLEDFFKYINKKA